MASPTSRRFPGVANDHRGQAGSCAGFEYDGSLMPVGYQRRQERLSPVRYLSARHRRANSVTLKNTAKHSSIELFFTSAAPGVKEADQVPQGDWGQQGSGSFICSRIVFQPRRGNLWVILRVQRDDWLRKR